MSTDLLVDINDGVALLTMNRPDARNAISQDMLALMRDALHEINHNADVGCVVLTGAREGRTFCPGGDVKRMARVGGGAGGGPDTPLEDAISNVRRGMEVPHMLHDMLKPTIAMVNGACAGAGLGLALACDMRTMARSAIMTSAFINVGFSGDYGGSYFLMKMLGSPRARELYYLSEIIDAEHALELGMTNRVFEDEALSDKTMEMAHRIASGPKIAYRYMKRNFNAAETLSLNDVLDLEAAHHVRCGKTEDHRNAVKAFAEKRKPVFEGR